MAITKEQVWEAADEIEAAGERPTLAAVRARIGGSFSTIGPALSEWKQRREEKGRSTREPVPPTIAEQASAFCETVWGAALELANARLASEREAMQRDRERIEADRSEAVELADRYAATIDELRERLKIAETQTEAANAELIQARAKLGQMAQIEARAEKDQQAALAAREKAAHLAGQVEALQQQIAGMLNKLGGKASKQAKTANPPAR